MRRLAGGLGYAPAAPAVTVLHAWSGNVTPNSATVKARSTDASSLTLRYSTSPDLSSASTVAGTEGNDDVFTFNLSGLTADTQYYFGFVGAEFTGRLHTFPTEGSAATFLVALAGDSGLNPQYAGSTARTSNAPTWDRIRERDPLLFMHLGDLHYRDLNTTNIASYRTAYRDVLANSRANHLWREIATDYTWDDHCYGPNDSNGTYTGKATAQAAYREYVPHWTLPGSEGQIYHTYAIGRVRFIHLDSRSGRVPNGTAASSSKTRLGAEQKAWLKATLLAAAEPLIVVNVVSWWGFTSGFADGWNNFAHERAELAEFFEDNALTSRLFLVGADIHELAFDDGTNTQFDTEAVTPGPPYAQFAPIDASFNHFSANYQQVYQTRRQQYGTMHFADDGTDITLTVKGYALSAAPGDTESEVFSEVLVY